MSPTPLIGRMAELDALVALVERAREGAGGVATLEGEAGIGKSRLLAEVEKHTSGLAHRVARADPLGQARPFGVLDRALAGLDLPPPSGEDRFARQDAIVEVIERECLTGPLLLVLDDLQWADAASVATLWMLALRAPHLPLALVLALRPTPRSTDLQHLVDGLADTDAVHLPIGALDRRDLTELARQILGTEPGPALDHELEGLGGNPFFVIEVLSSLVESGAVSTGPDQAEVRLRSLPPSARHTVLRRMTALSPESEQILQASAVLGAEIDSEELAAVLDRDVGYVIDHVGQLIRAGLLDGEGDTLRFRHDLLRELVYEDTPSAVRQTLHRRTATALRSRGASPDRLAPHLVAQPDLLDPERVLDLRTTAAALESTSPDVAAQLLDVAATGSAGSPDGIEIRVEHAEALLHAGRPADARVIARSLHDRETTVRSLLVLGKCDEEMGDAHAALESFDRAATLLAPDDPRGAWLQTEIATTCLWSFQIERAWAEAQTAIDRGTRDHIPDAVTGGLTIQSRLAATAGRFDEGVALAERAVEAAGDDTSALRRDPYLYLALNQINQDDFEGALVSLTQAREQATARGWPSSQLRLHGILAMRHYYAGAWDDALAECDAATIMAGDLGSRSSFSTVRAVRALVSVHRGDFDTARRAIEEGQAELATVGSDQSGLPYLAWATVLLDSAEGRAAATVEAVAPLFEMAALLAPAVVLWPAADVVSLAVDVGKLGFASAITEQVESLVAIGAHSPTARAAALQIRGMVDNDLALLVDAAAVEGAGRRPAAWMASAERAATALIAAGQADRAVPLLEEVRSVASQLGALPVERRVRALLRDCGIRSTGAAPASRPASGMDSLTPTERQVLDLVAAGLSNPEIAAHLVISKRTVESHMSRLYTKLDVTNRVALARLTSSV